MSRDVIVYRKPRPGKRKYKVGTVVYRSPQEVTQYILCRLLDAVEELVVELKNLK